MDVRGHLQEGRLQLAENDDPGSAPRLEAELLLALALEVDRSFLFAHPEHPVDRARARVFRTLIRRRADGEPLAYITGRRSFWTLDLAVNADVLIPRPETERLVELALDRLPTAMPTRVADIGTGSGAIALALARERPRARVLGTDISPAAVRTARENARRLAITNVDFAEGAWCLPLHGADWDMVVSNPPYVAEDDPHLSRGDVRFEPRLALTPGADPLAAFRAIAGQAAARLKPGGHVLFEHGFEQGPGVRRVIEEAGYEEPETYQDLQGLDRVSAGRKSD